jgi:ferrochelatase
MRYPPPLCSARRLDPDRPVGLIYLGLGGPDGPDAVGPFLSNLFADPMVLPLPSWLSKPLGKIIVRRRVKSVREKYLSLGYGGGSPQLDWCNKQAAVLAADLAGRGIEVHPAVAMRYWHPFTDEALRHVRERGAEQLLVVPTYPQYSAATTGSSLVELERVLKATGWDPPRHILRDWPLLPGYVQLLARQAADVLERWLAEGKDPGDIGVVYTAHSLPERFPRRGDAYVKQTRATVRAVHDLLAARPGGLLDGLRAGGDQPLLVFQSKVGPVKWIGPPTEETCIGLVKDGVRHLLVVPVSFNCEHIETIDELDNELAEEVREAGAVDFARTPALNLDADWLASLADRLAVRAFGLEPAASRSGNHE